MIDITKLKLYPAYSRSIFIPINAAKKISVIFYPENSTLIDAYASLRIRKQFVKKATFLSAKLPILRNAMSELMKYKQIKLIPFGVQKPKENVFIDCGPYLDKLDASYGKASYKRPQVLNKIIDYLSRCQDHLPNMSILLYYIDMNKPCSANIFLRRIYVLYYLARGGNGAFPFDIVCLVSNSSKGILYTNIYNKAANKRLSPSKIFSILKRFIVKPKDAEGDDEETTAQEAKDKIKSLVGLVKPNVTETINKWANINRG